MWADKHMGRKHFLTVNCPCRTTHNINPNFRKHYRKEVSIGGYYTADDSAPGNCRIKKISMGGLGFTALNKVRVQVEDRLKIKFTLDKIPPEIIEKEAVVRTIKDYYIDCEFIEESGYTDRTLGFYLMK